MVSNSYFSEYITTGRISTTISTGDERQTVRDIKYNHEEFKYITMQRQQLAAAGLNAK